MTFKKRVKTFFHDLLSTVRPRLVKALVLGCTVAMVGLVLAPLRFVLSLEEDTGLGLLFKLRGARPAPAEVVVVSIDRDSAEEFGIPDNPDKWPRALHARLIEELAREGAAVIAFDVHFIEARSAADDNLLADCAQKAGNVVLCEPMVAREVPFDGGGAPGGAHSIVKIVRPLELFARAAAATAPFPLPRIPFKVNSSWAFQTEAGDSPTLPVVAFQLYSLPAYEAFVSLLARVSPGLAEKLPSLQAVSFADKTVVKSIRAIREVFAANPLLAEGMLKELENSTLRADDPGRYRLLRSLIALYGGPSSRFINYFGPPRSIATIPYHQALQIHEDMAGGQRLDLKGKVVFVGLSEVLLAERKDSFYTEFSQENGIFIPGVEIMATAFADILQDTPVRPLNSRLHILVIAFWGLLLGIACYIYSVKAGGAGAVVLGIFYLGGALYQFKANHVWHPLVVPLFFQLPLAFAGAFCIEHFRLFKETLEKLRMDEDLSVARKVQMGMLPGSCPEIKGYQIAASSFSAKEVGGDFYDFIQINDDRLGFVVADVAGKSVSGALVMTAARSMLRMLTGPQMTVSQIMTQANRRIKEDINTKGMFVALLYAALDIESKTMRICSAGQSHPIHYSMKSGEATLVETAGDSFPLGIIDDVDYQETDLKLAPGDSMVFYTDGVVEAMNPTKELYGFDRFIKAVKENQGLAAHALLGSLMADVSSFVGKAPQHDDLTMVVVRVE